MMTALNPARVFAVPDGMGTGPSAHAQIVEVVTFRLMDGVKPEAFAKAAAAIKPFLDATGAVTARTLSRAEDGTWTDHIRWTTLEQAKTAAEEIFARPEAAPLMAMIDPESVELKHAPILYQTG